MSGADGQKIAPTCRWSIPPMIAMLSAPMYRLLSVAPRSRWDDWVRLIHRRTGVRGTTAERGDDPAGTCWDDRVTA
ncbi:hypothetical protein Abr02nite_05830 [Paractinoplanes brasiliensis]|nr:hypothetical protein Abr02nite_05830 [Actinoplanes brasiliensis]